MDILFASKKLEQLCHDDKLATRTLGAPSARKLRARLDDLIAAADLGYAPRLPGRFHGLTGDRAGQYSLHLGDGCRLVFQLPNELPPALPDGTPDLSKVTIVTVVFIGDYHE